MVKKGPTGHVPGWPPGLFRKAGVPLLNPREGWGRGSSDLSFGLTSHLGGGLIYSINNTKWMRYPKTTMGGQGARGGHISECPARDGTGGKSIYGDKFPDEARGPGL